MGSRQEIADYLVGQISDAGEVFARKMFGEYGIYCGGKMIALIADDQLFIKPTPAGKIHLGEVEEAAPYPGAKPWLRVPEERWDDAQWLAELARITADALPPPKPKPPKKAKTQA